MRRVEPNVVPLTAGGVCIPRQVPKSSDDAVEVLQNVRRIPDQPKLEEFSTLPIRAHRFAVRRSSQDLLSFTWVRRAPK